MFPPICAAIIFENNNVWFVKEIAKLVSFAKHKMAHFPKSDISDFSRKENKNYLKERKKSSSWNHFFFWKLMSYAWAWIYDTYTSRGLVISLYLTHGIKQIKRRKTHTNSLSCKQTSQPPLAVVWSYKKQISNNLNIQSLHTFVY